MSVYIICWIFLQTFQTYFCIQANMWTLFRLLPEEQSDLGPHCLLKGHITPSMSQYNLNNVEKDVKHQLIIWNIVLVKKKKKKLLQAETMKIWKYACLQI